MTRTAPGSLSVYRGQSRRGIGEGPGSLTAHGEQYLGASPPLDQDGDLLEAIRPWMTLDSDPADHQRLSDRLEAWSLFRHRDRQFVVRLVSAGAYDSRAGYFAHGRAWPLDAGPGFDPGLHLGRSEAFESPWRDDDPGRRVEEPAPALVRPDRIAAEPERAAQLLAQLLQCSARRRSLIIAAPVSEFAAGAALHALVSFARGALPADLRQDCRVRIYTHTPELFLRLGATLVAVPEELAAQALKARREATLVDRHGKLLAGEPLERVALAYAEAVIERALRIPEGLTAFGERFRDRRSRPGLPEERDVQALQATYNLAVALAGSEEERGDLLRSYLPKVAQKLGPEADWQRLIAPGEWRGFPRESLLDLLLLDSASLSPGTRELQKTAELAAAQLGLAVDSRLADWWDPAEPAKLRRLLELGAHRPPLVSPSALAERTAVLPLRRIAETGAAEAILEAELRHGSLRRRSAESIELGELASSPGVLRVLLQAVERGVLGTAWARAFVERAPGPALAAAAPELLQVPGLFQEGDPWADIAELFLDRLRALPSVPQSLAPFILQAGRAVDPESSLPLYLRLADVIARIDQESGRQGENLLVSRLWRDMPASPDRKVRELLVDVALSPDWRCLQPRSLAEQGKLRSGLEALAARLAPHEGLLRELDIPSLLRLAGQLEVREDLERIFDFVDLHVVRDLRSTVDALILSGWWTAWRRMSRLLIEDPEKRRRAAEAWLTSRTWIQEKMEAALEDWKQTVADLPADLDQAGMAALWSGRSKPCRFWPWIPPFEAEQIEDLVEKASDLTALAELTEALADPSPLDLGEPLHRWILRHSRFAHELQGDAIGWLLDPETRGELAPLDLGSALRLWSLAGPRADRACEARLRSIVECLQRDESPEEAIHAAGEPDLWDSPELLAAVAAWMIQRGSLQRIGSTLVQYIEAHLGDVAIIRPKPVPEKLVRELAKAGFKRVARLLSPDLSRLAEKETLEQSVLDALAYGWRDNECWRELAEEVERSTGFEHPLSSIAAEIRRFPLEAQRDLGLRGWDTFEAAARSHPELLSFRAAGPPVLPVFDLAATLSRPGGLGGAALRTVFSATGADLRAQAGWWDALLMGLLVWRRYPAPLDCPEDRLDAALALLMQALEDLRDDEQQVFWRALERRAADFPEWDLPLELGKR
jgi:hypothetical protein